MHRLCSNDRARIKRIRASQLSVNLVLCSVITFVVFSIASPIASSARADNLTLEISGTTIELDGEILIEAVDKSLYFRSTDGKIWFVKPEQIKAKDDDDSVVKPITKKKLGKQLLAELPDGFRIYETKHYVIAYQNELAYARWIGGLYESRLYRAFETFWQKKKKFDLDKPDFPLTAIIFGSKAQYGQYVTRELGAGQTMVAYYNLQTNRVTMYDLTADRRNPNQALDDRKIDQILQNPAVIPMVATIIHEGTHQLIFNRGMQTRFAETPLWLNEGLAIYFETPNLKSARGWRVPGLVNRGRLRNFIQYYPKREKDALKKMIESDDRLRDPETALDGYAEAWAFNHFLLNKRSEEYVNYLKFMSTKKALITDEPATRVAEFKRFLGDDLGVLDKAFIEYVRGLK